MKTVIVILAVLIVVGTIFCIGGFIGFVLQGKPDVVADDTKPLSAHLIPANDKWKEAYGDTLETQMAWNLAVIRHDQRAIFNLVQVYHADPNEIKSNKLKGTK